VVRDRFEIEGGRWRIRRRRGRWRRVIVRNNNRWSRRRRLNMLGHMGVNPNEAIVIEIIVVTTRSGTVGRTISGDDSWTGREDLSIVRRHQFRRVEQR
jgi:hypothetical protein